MARTTLRGHGFVMQWSETDSKKSGPEGQLDVQQRYLTTNGVQRSKT